LNGTPTSPEFVVEQVIDDGGEMVKAQLDETAPAASLTWMVKVPGAVGVPVMAPVEALSVRPCGRVPVATENVYGAVPPLMVIAGLLNGTPTWPEFVVEQVMLGAGTIVYRQVVATTTPFESVTWILKVPGAVGVPVMAPVDVFNVRPAGRVLAGASEKV
jgi:hypothetical protein